MRGMTKFGWLISEPFGFVTSQPRLNLSQASLWAQHWDKAWQLGMGSKEAASKYFSIVFVFLYYCINISLLFIIVILYFCISISLLEWRDLLKIWGRRLSAFVEEWGETTFTFTRSWHHAMLRHLLSFVCDPRYCVHIQSQVTTAFHSYCIGTCSKFHRQRSLKRMCIVIERSILTQIISQLWTHTLWCSLHRTWIYSCA